MLLNILIFDDLIDAIVARLNEAKDLKGVEMKWLKEKFKEVV